jgi:U3 small nucleolar RNA-associated protein 12
MLSVAPLDRICVVCVRACCGHPRFQTKVWNAKTMSCVRSIECGFALCCGFGPGNRHGLIGTKTGSIQVFDLASGDLVEEVADAHEGAIWGLAVRPDDRGFVTGGADKQVKFWDFELKTGASDGSGAKQLTVVHTRALLMTAEVQCIAYSHHTDAAKLLVAVGLLDNTVKVGVTAACVVPSPSIVVSCVPSHPGVF